MVVRKAQRNRKYLGTRRWGVGNIKNARGHGSKGGAGRAGSGLGTGSKHKFTYITAKHPELIRKVGFTRWNQLRELRYKKEITLKEVERLLSRQKDRTIELRQYKVLSNGNLSSKAIVKASGFSAAAKEKIKGIGGEAIVL